MAEVHFYHLTRTPLEAAAPPLLEKCLARGWRVTLRAGSAERVAALNRHLWTWRDDSFLPHGAAEDGHGARQPVWLTAGPDMPNDPQALMLADGAEAAPEEMARLERTLLLFDGHDEAALAAARGIWRSVTSAGLKAIYWSEGAEGGWAKTAERGG